jgi:hypothetical protein
MAGPAGGGQPPGHDSFQASQQHSLQQQGAANKTGAHNLLFTGSPMHNVSPNVQKAYWEGLIPGFKTSPAPKFGGGLNSRAKPIDLKKMGYQPPPGYSPNSMGEGAFAAILNNSQGALAGIQNQSQGALAGIQHGGESKSNAGAMQASMAANTTQNALAAAQSQAQHTSPQFKHMAQLGFGQNIQAFSGMDPLRQQNIFQSHLYSRMSPHDYMNYMPLNPFTASPSYSNSATQHHNQIIAAQQAAMAQQSKGRA